MKTKKAAAKTIIKEKSKAPRLSFMGRYFTITWSKILTSIGLILIGFSLGALSLAIFQAQNLKANKAQAETNKYWFMLHRKSNIELLYKGKPGSALESKLIHAFQVKVGIPGQRPTPLPELAGRKYWVLTKKYETKDIPETAPYFIELNVPAPSTVPYGPTPYMECDGQCNWEISGPFGLHGINGDSTRLDSTNLGSSGCVRHTDSDITYLYNLLDPEKNEIRYYIKDI